VLQRREDVELMVYDLDKSSGDLERGLEEADVVFHLAGVNRPEREDEFFARVRFLKSPFFGSKSGF